MKILVFAFGFIVGISAQASNKNMDETKATALINRYLIVKNLGGSSEGTPEGYGPAKVNPKILCPAATGAVDAFNYFKTMNVTDAQIGEMVELLDDGTAEEVSLLRKEVLITRKKCSKKNL
ncbi:MAG: hypothetical protein ACXVCY_11350 [Pseudobdellovibrionaceae bacterium]